MMSTSLRSAAYRTSRRQKARVEIIPLIDVMFLLVAFFMLISISMVLQKGIFVDLSPASTSDAAAENTESRVISLDASGALYLDKSLHTAEGLLDELQKLSIKDKDTSVTINADKATPHQHVIEALDIVRKSGLHNIIFAVEPISE